MHKIVIVRNKYTNKLYPFSYKPNGEIELLTTQNPNIDDLIVSNVPYYTIDLLNGYYIPEERLWLDGSITNT